MRAGKFVGAGIVLIVGCSGDSGVLEPPPDNHEQMVLESIPYDALGSTRLTFRRDEDDTERRGIVSLDGSSRTSSITYSVWGGFVAASPTSSNLVYEGSAPNYQEREVDIFVREWAAPSGTQMGGPGGMRESPSWSTDGARIIYGESAARFDLYSTSIVTQAPAPGAVRQVLWSATRSCEYGEDARQNAAGVLVFVHTVADPAFCVGDKPRIATLAPGGALQSIYGSGSVTYSPVFSPTWSPSGAEIGFLESGGTYAAPTTIVKRMAADGSDVRTVAVLPVYASNHVTDYSMCWPGDGARIFFSLRDGATESHIYSGALADGTVTKITTASGVRDWSVSCN